MATNEFFLINDIQKRLYCCYCENRLDLPKILPCGKTICSKCETSYIYSSDKECKSCLAIHAIPPNGFPVNDLAAQFLQITPARVYRGEIHKKTMDMVNEIGIKKKLLQDHLQSIHLVISDYCDTLRTCVDIKTESEIILLNSYRDLFLSRIDSYEKECKEKSKSEPLKLDDLMNECNYNHVKWTQFLNKENITDIETSLVLKEATKQMNSLAALRKEFEKSIFGPRKLVFYENKIKTSPSIIGSITGCINQELEVKLNYKIEKTATYHKPFLVKVNDKTVCLAASIQNITGNLSLFHLKLAIITDGVVTKEIKEPLNQTMIQFTSVKFKDFFVVHNFTTTGQPVFRTYAFNLKLIKTVNQNYFFSVLLTDEKLIYGYSPNNSLWFIFDENLNLIESKAIGNGSAYPFITHKDSQVELKYGYLFSYFNRELRVVDNEKRTLLVSLKLDEKIFPNPTFVRPCSSDTFYVIDSLSKTIKSFDFKFNCLFEFKIDSIAEISSVSLTNDGDIVFYDYKATTAYLF